MLFAERSNAREREREDGESRKVGKGVKLFLSGKLLVLVGACGTHPVSQENRNEGKHVRSGKKKKVGRKVPNSSCVFR